MTNFLDRYVDFAEKLTDAPIEFHRFIGYAIVGIALGRNIHFPLGSQKIYPNFYMAIIAPSSIYRKSTVLSLGQKVLRRFRKHLILPSEFTQEKLLDVLKENSFGSFFFYEFKTLLGILNKDYNAGLKAFLTELYDCPEYYSRATKSSMVEIENPCVSILTATTMKWFVDTIKEGDMEGGFLTRFLFVPATAKHKLMPIPPKMDDADVESLVRYLEDLSKVRAEFSFSEDGKKEFESWYIKQASRMESEDNSSYKSSMSRMSVYLIKFAMLNALIFNRASIIGAVHVREAIITVNWLSQQTESIIKEEMAETKFGKYMKKLIHLLKSAPDKTMSTRDIMRRLDLNTKLLNDMVEALEEREEISVERFKNGHGRASRNIKFVG